jgi:hypothetical protein
MMEDIERLVSPERKKDADPPCIEGKIRARAKTVMRLHIHTSLLNDCFHFKQHEVKCNRVLHTPSAPVSPTLTAIGQFVDTMLKRGASVPDRVTWRKIITTHQRRSSRMRDALLPEFTYRQGWWLLGGGVVALVAARIPSGLLSLVFFLVGMVLLSIAGVTFLRIEAERRGESDG